MDTTHTKFTLINPQTGNSCYKSPLPIPEHTLVALPTQFVNSQGSNNTQYGFFSLNSSPVNRLGYGNQVNIYPVLMVIASQTKG